MGVVATSTPAIPGGVVGPATTEAAAAAAAAAFFALVEEDHGAIFLFAFLFGFRANLFSLFFSFSKWGVEMVRLCEGRSAERGERREERERERENDDVAKERKKSSATSASAPVSCSLK